MVLTLNQQNLNAHRILFDCLLVNKIKFHPRIDFGTKERPKKVQESNLYAPTA